MQFVFDQRTDNAPSQVIGPADIRIESDTIVFYCNIGVEIPYEALNINL